MSTASLGSMTVCQGDREMCVGVTLLTRLLGVSVGHNNYVDSFCPNDMIATKFLATLLWATLGYDD